MNKYFYKPKDYYADGTCSEKENYEVEKEDKKEAAYMFPIDIKSSKYKITRASVKKIGYVKK